MTNIRGYSADAAQSYKAYGEKVLEESKSLLKKNGIDVPVFDTKAETKQDVFVTKKPDYKPEDKKPEENKETKELSQTTDDAMQKRNPLKFVKNSTSFMSTVYNAALLARSSIVHQDSNSDDFDEDIEATNEQQTIDFTDDLGTMNENGNDNEELEKFLSEDAQDGFHIQASAYEYVENSNDYTEYSTSATLFSTYNSKDKKFTSLLGGTLEYSKLNPKNDYEDRQKNIQLNGYLYSKYDTGKFTVAGSATTNQTKGNQNYTIGLGAMHNSTGIAVTAVRNIDVTYNESGERYIDNRTNIKINLLENDPSKRKTMTSPYNPTDQHTTVIPDGSADEAKSKISEEESAAKDIEKYGEDNGYGWGVDLELNTSSMSEEYGGTVYYSKLVKDIKDDNHYKLVVTPFLGLYDVHPNSDESFKAKVGVIGDYSLRHDNGLEIDMTAVVQGSRTMQNGCSPTNMFMTSFNGRAQKGKWSGELKAGYIINNTNLQFSYVSAFLERCTKNMKLYFEAAYGSYHINGNNDNVSHLGIGCILDI